MGQSEYAPCICHILVAGKPTLICQVMVGLIKARLGRVKLDRHCMVGHGGVVGMSGLVR